MTLRAIVLALVAATVLAALATDAVARAAAGPCNDVEAVEPGNDLSFLQQKDLAGAPVIVATAGKRVEKTFGGYEYDLGPVKLDCESLQYAGNDAHSSTYDACVARPKDACHASSGMQTGYMFRADDAVLEHDRGADTYVVRLPNVHAGGVGTRAFKIAKGTRPPSSIVPVVVIWCSLAMALHAVIVLRRRERFVATLQEGIVELGGRVRPKDGSASFATKPHAFEIDSHVTFEAAPREPTYRAEDAIAIFPSLTSQIQGLKATRGRAWLGILAALVIATVVAFVAR